MLAPLENRNAIERADRDAEALRSALAALRSERDFDRCASVQRIAVLTDEVARLRGVCEAQRRQLDAYASGEAVISLGRRLMALSAANDGLRAAAEQARTLQAQLAAAHDDCRRLADERDALAAGTAMPAGKASAGEASAGEASAGEASASPARPR